MSTYKNSDGRLTKEEMQAFVGEAKIPDAFFKKFENWLIEQVR